MKKELMFDINGIYTITERLILRNVREEDYNSYFELNKQITVFEKFFDETFMKELWKSFYDDDDLVCSIFQKEDNEFCGQCMLKRIKSETPEIGINLLRCFQNQGFAAEALTALMSKAVEMGTIKYFVSRVDFKNVHSQHLMKKLGAKLVGKDFVISSVLQEAIRENLGRDSLEDFGCYKYILKK